MPSPRRTPRPTRALRRAKLRWRCRRGMKELDVLLERFLMQGFDEWDDEQLERLEILLDYPDQVLLDWLGGGAAPGDAGLADIVRRIRSRIAVGPRASADLPERR